MSDLDTKTDLMTGLQRNRMTCRSIDWRCVLLIRAMHACNARPIPMVWTGTGHYNNGRALDVPFTDTDNMLR